MGVLLYTHRDGNVIFIVIAMYKFVPHVTDQKLSTTNQVDQTDRVIHTADQVKYFTDQESVYN